MPKRYWRPPRDYYDEELKHAKRVAREIDLPFLIENGDDEDMRRYAKKRDPEVTEEELERIVSLFHDAKRERGRER